MGIGQLQGAKDAKGAKRHDKRRQLHLGHQNAVEQAHAGANTNTHQNGNRGRPAVVDRKVAHDQRRHHEDFADRQVDPRRQDHHGLRQSDKTCHRNLLQHRREGTHPQKPRGHNAKRENRDHQHQRRDHRGIVAQIAPKHRNRGFVIAVKLRNRFVSRV